MYPSAFDYVAVDSVEAAIAQLHSHGEDARLLAGGQSLIPMLKLRLLFPSVLVDIGRVTALNSIGYEPTAISLGAMVRHSDVADSTEVWQRLPLVAEAASAIGDQQVRNWGTVGGGLAEADAAGNWAVAALAAGAEIIAEGPSGSRRIAASDFFVGMYETVLQPDEILTGVRFPLPSTPRFGGTFTKFRRRTGDFATASVAVQLSLAPDGSCESIGIGLGAVAPLPLKAQAAEEVLLGTRLEADAIEEACDRIDDVTDPIPDLRGPVHYKKSISKTLFRRAVRAAAEQAEGREAA